MAQLAVKPTVEYNLKLVKGPDKGAVYKLVSQQVSIGRSSDNDIVLANDPKCSRNHAKIIITPEDIQILVLSEHNPITVDGQSGLRFSLKNNSKIKLGNSVLVLEINMIMGENKPMAMARNEQPQASGQMSTKQNYELSQAPSSSSSGFPIRYIMYAVGVVALVYFLMGQSTKPKEEVELITEAEIDHKIEQSAELAKALELERQQKGKNSVQYREAQSHYIRGFRDFRKGQFERSIQSFEACLSIFPAHVLCQRYKKLSEKKFQELIQYHMILGRKYLDQGQYQSCRSSFRNVKNMVKNPQSKVYKEAHANFFLCDTKLKDRF